MINQGTFIQSSSYLGRYFTIHLFRPTPGKWDIGFGGSRPTGWPSRRARARQYGGAPNIEPGTRDDGLLLRAGAGLEPAARGQTASWLTQGLDEASMGKASRTKVDASRREKIAAQRAA